MDRKSKVMAGIVAGALAWVGVAGAAEGPSPSVAVSREGYVLQAQVHGAGPVAVVFESGFGQGAAVWEDVIEAFGDDCRCIAYARAGLDDSGSDGAPKSIDAHLQDLGAVMDALAPDGRVVLVGHSYGGLLATEFARRWPQRLRGIVLVDPATMGQRHAMKRADAARVQADDAMLLEMLPPPMAADYRTLVAQLDAAAPMPAALPEMPVVLLTATQIADEPFVFEETVQGKAIWKQQHAALFATASAGSHRYFATGHNLHHEQPAAVADAIREIAAATP